MYLTLWHYSHLFYLLSLVLSCSLLTLRSASFCLCSSISAFSLSCVPDFMALFSSILLTEFSSLLFLANFEVRQFLPLFFYLCVQSQLCMRLYGSSILLTEFGSLLFLANFEVRQFLPLFFYLCVQSQLCTRLYGSSILLTEFSSLLFLANFEVGQFLPLFFYLCV